ncbi:unnamed protein product, partial [Discosporangium mesarthrocarpum]
LLSSPYSLYPLQSRPMVRVAVEALHQRDMAKLELGLSRLYQADPAVEVCRQ